MRRVRRGDIGKPILAQVSYHDTSVRPQSTEGLSPAEGRMRNFYFYRALAGDLLLSRDIHVIDGANFFVGSHPEKAMGIGRRSAHTVGDCHDNFILTFWYPGDCVVAFSSTEFTTGYRDMCMRFYGTLGTLDAHYNGMVTIGGTNPWPGVQKDDTYRAGAVANIKAFIEAIHTGKVLNNVDDAVDSTLAALLGRMAADSGRLVTWEEVLRDKQRLDPQLEGARAAL
jgi:predicted dehydrogenase